MKNIKSILAILAAVMSVSFAYAQENTAEPVAAQPAQAQAQQAEESTVDTKFGKVKVKKSAGEKASTLEVSLGMIPSGADAREVISALCAVASKAVDQQHAAAIQAMAAALNTKNLGDASGKPIVFSIAIPNEGGNPDLTLNLGASSAHFVPVIASTENGASVKGDLALAVEGSEPVTSKVDLTVPADGSNVSGTIDSAAVVVPQASKVPAADTAKAETPSAEATTAETPDNSVKDPEISKK